LQGKEETGMKETIEAAADIYFGEFISISPENINPERFVTTNNPETILINKNRFQHLSKEAKNVIAVILNAPDEMFFADGRIRKAKLYLILRKLQLSWKVIFSVETELKSFLSIS
jgi:hypothetical protein